MKITKTRLNIAERRVKVSKMLANGIPKQEIAEKLGVSPGTITGDSKAVYQLIKDRMAKNADHLKAVEIHIIDEGIREAWAAWYRSTRTEKILKKRETEDPEKGLIIWNEETKKKLIGNPRFLEVIALLSKNRQELLGLKEPVKLETPEGGITVILRKATDDDVNRSRSTD